MTSRLRLVVLILSLVFVVAHVRALPRTLGDIDSINFALGVESFDVAEHQPHPPGYPVFIALGKATTGLLHAVAPSWGRDRLAASGLAVISVAAGGAAIWILTAFWLAVGFTPRLAVLAATLAAASPLFWFTASRPLSDTAGLVAATAVIALLIRSWQRWTPGDPAPAAWQWGAFAAGVIIGLRSQTMWQTAPVLAVMVATLVIRRRVSDGLVLTAAAALGAALWFAPLVQVTGGVDAFFVALGNQGAQDFSGVEMLATMPSGALLADALDATFVAPWHAKWLAQIVLLLSVVGLARSVAGRQLRTTAALVALSFLPYLAFHLLFHETATVRYALPLLVPVSGFAVLGLAWVGERAATIGVVFVAAAGLITTQPLLERDYAPGVPVFRAFQDMVAARPATGDRPEVRTHHQVWWGVRRAMDWYRPVWDFGLQPFPGDREWLGLVNDWRNGATRPVWFLADLGRHDLEAFDARTSRLRGRYEMDPGVRRLIRGTRLDSLNWWDIERPFWMLGTGWALNPELAGMTTADRVEPHRGPAEAFVLRSPVARRVLIGGRSISGGAGPPARLTLSVDDEVRDVWVVPPEQRWFVRWIDLPGSPTDATTPYVRIAVGVESAEAARPVPDAGLIALEQFDAAPVGTLMFAYLEDWYERESDPRLGTTWRWSADASTLEVRDWPGELTLTLRGESPLRYFDAAPVVRILAGSREIARFSPSADFTETVIVPADAIAAAGGRLTIATDRTFSPQERGQSADARRLGLRLFSIDLTGR